MGACLLPALPEPPSGLYRGLFQRYQLEQGFSGVRGAQIAVLNSEKKTPDTPGFFLCLMKSEKGREVSALFIPNLTINLTYLCYGTTKILVLRGIKKKILQNPQLKSVLERCLSEISGAIW